MLFTAFEPSGDDHAAAVIAELRRRHPDMPIYAWGGPMMERAGATIIERTGDNAVMGLPGLGKVLEHRRINKRIARWLAGEGKGKVAVHVPVDSPAANFPICRIARRRRSGRLKIVHLVAPQVWAWASWRVRKLRRLTDLVLCLLPFEETWFLERGVPAKFIGHPLFDHAPDLASCDERSSRFPGGTPKLALMPGSRPSEMENCFPILLDAFRRLKQDFPQTTAVVAATRPEAAEKLHAIAAGAASAGAPDSRASPPSPEGGSGWPADMHVVCGDTDAVIRWCDFAMVVSGTVTLQIARQRKPMVAVYRPNKLMYHLLGRWLVATELFTLPNLISGRRILPEFIPHFSDGEDLAVEVIKFMRRTGYADDQRAALDAVCRRFDGMKAGPNAADAIERVLGLRGDATTHVPARDLGLTPASEGPHSGETAGASGVPSAAYPPT